MWFFPTSPLYLMLVGPAIILAIWAQMKVKRAFDKYRRVGSSSGLSGAEAAAQMLGRKGLRVVNSTKEAMQMDNAVAIRFTRGFLSDHYDPRNKTLNLSRTVYEGRSLASVGVACHEAGHALQHAQDYAPLKMRNTMVPVASFGSWVAFPVIILGLVMHTGILMQVGILLLAVIVLLQLITLPVEFDASKRAKQALRQMGIIGSQAEANGVAAVLDAAAWTYVAAAVSAVMTLLYWILVITGGSRD